MSELFNVRLCRILPKSAQALADLLLLNFAIASVIEQVEGFLKFCETSEVNDNQISSFNFHSDYLSFKVFGSISSFFAS